MNDSLKRKSLEKSYFDIRLRYILHKKVEHIIFEYTFSTCLGCIQKVLETTISASRALIPCSYLKITSKELLEKRTASLPRGYLLEATLLKSYFGIPQGEDRVVA